MSSGSFAVGGHAELGLDVDVDAEIEVLAHAPLQGRWQAPAELVRFLLARGAAAVDVEIRRGGYQLVGSSAAVEVADLERLVVVLDRGAAATARHAAVVELEATEAMPLLWAAGAARARWRFRLEAASGTIVASGGAGLVAEVAHSASGAHRRLVLEVREHGFDRRRAAEWLRSVCRFARAPVRLDGLELGVGLREGAFRARLEAPVPCAVAIGVVGDAPALWLLRHGVVAARATVPGFPPFHAAVELAAVTAPGASPSEVRAAVQPFLSDLIEETVRLLVRATARLPELAPERQRTMRLALLRAASLGLQRQRILELPLVSWGTPGRRSRWLSLADLSRAGRPPAAASERELTRLGLGGARAATVVVLGPEERELVWRLIGVRLTPPPAAVTASPVASLRRALRRSLALSFWRAAMTRWIVPMSEVAAGEANLAETIRRWSWPPTGEAEVAFVAGRGRPWTHGGRLLLPRGSPRVTAAVRALAAGPAWRYPVLLAVVPDHWVVDPGLAEAWRTAAGLST